MSDHPEPSARQAIAPSPTVVRRVGAARGALLGPGLGWALVSAILTGVAGAALLAGAARGSIGASVASAWLAEQGVPAEIRVERLDANRFTGTVRLGSPDAPDLVSEHVELAFTPALTLKSARLVRPRLKIAYQSGRLRFGSLQRLIDQALAAKPTGAPAPDIVIEDGLATVATPVGPLRLKADARLDRGQLVRLDARLLPATLAGDAGVARIERARLVLDGVPGGARGRLQVGAPELRSETLRLAGGALDADLDLGLQGLAPTGRMRVDGAITAARFDGGGAQLSAPRLHLQFDGDATGPLERLSVSGQGGAAFRADRVHGASGAVAAFPTLTVTLAQLTAHREGARVRADADLAIKGRASRVALTQAMLNGVEIEARYPRLRLRSEAKGVSLEGAGQASMAAAEARFGGVRLTRTSARALGPIAFAGGLARFGGALNLAGGVPREDAERLAGALPVAGARLATALTRLAAVAAKVEASGGGNAPVSVVVGAPLTVTGAGGAKLAFQPRGDSPLLRLENGAARGAFDLTASGLGFSRLRVSSADYAFGAGRRGLEGGVAANVSLALDGSALSGAELGGLTLDGPLQATRHGGELRAALPGCATAKLARFGAAVRAASTEICPASEPLLRLAGGRWTAAARLREARATLVPAQAQLAGAGELTARGGAGPLRAEISLTPITARDLAPATRFAPLTASGRIALAELGWSGRLAIATQAGQALGTATVNAARDGGAGKLALDSGALVFTQNGFQPDALSPLAPKAVSKLEGPLHVAGEIAWRSGAVSASSGRLETSGIDFTGPLGRVTRARGAIAFSSLLPLETPPGQAVVADSVAWIAPLDALRVGFQLTPEAIRLEAAQAGVSGGRARLDPLTVSFKPGATTRGVLRLAGVDIGALIARSNLADKLNLQAKLSGAVPFALGPEGVRFADGRVAADGPGRLSISRAALAGGDVKTSGVQDIAYQALENLAFDTLDATLASQAKGRLGVLFHINGRHDPPRATETRIDLFDLIGGHALDKSLPLPKGTPVNLTLDTSLNFDELLAAYQAASRSEPVQAEGGR